MPEPSDIRLLVVDIDGTIAGESNQISPAVKQAIRAVQDRGIEVAIATGRMFRSALRFYEDIGSTLPLMAYQGALIQDPADGTVHQHLSVSAKVAAQLLDYLEDVETQLPGDHPLSIHFYLNDQLYVREITAETEAYSARSGIEPIAVGDLRNTLDQEPTKILALSQDTAFINQLLSSLRERYTPAELYFTTSVETFFEAAHPLVNKGLAVRYLAEEVLNLRPDQVMAIGDNFNDVEMLEYAGLGVAMGNAPAVVQAFADWVAPTVEEDGVAIALEKWLLS